MPWSDTFMKVFKNNDIRLVAYAVKIDDKPGPIQTPRDPTAIRASFMKGMGTSRGGALDG